MYAIVENNQVIEWPVMNLQQRFPQISFPSPVSDTSLPHNVVRVTVENVPVYNQSTHKVVLGDPQNIDGKWVRCYSVEPLTAAEIESQIADKLLSQDAARAEAYRTESDPLFFKSQRGEATHQEWLDKVAEIKARYTY